MSKEQSLTKQRESVKNQGYENSRKRNVIELEIDDHANQRTNPKRDLANFLQERKEKQEQNFQSKKKQRISNWKKNEVRDEMGKLSKEE